MKAIAVSYKEGGDFIDLSNSSVVTSELLDASPKALDNQYVAYKFPDETIWDSRVGWRRPPMATTLRDMVKMREFPTGATRNLDHDQLDYEAFLSPLVLECYAEYMHGKRLQADGTVRDGDNWQKGIPLNSYMKSGWRHFFDWWKLHRALTPLTPTGEQKLNEALCAIMFNVMGYLHERLKKKS